MRSLIDTFKALADDTRLRILALVLLRGEICVCDVEAILDITQSKASRHARYLRNAGLLEDRRDGVWVHYRVAGDLDPERRRLLESLPGLIGDAGMAELHRKLDAWLAAKEEGQTCRTIGASLGSEEVA
ncbi:MAG: ArsR/SmtB family transcription factor [Myxococcota bacterium]